MDQKYFKAAAPWLILLLLFYVLPIAGLVAISFTDPANSGDGSTFTLANFQAVFDPEVGRMAVMARTLLAGIVVVLISAFIATPVAYFLGKVTRSPKLESFVLVVVAATFLIGPLVRTLAWRGMLGTQGVINTLLLQIGIIEKPLPWLLYSDFSVLTAMVYNSFPFMLFTVYLAVKTVDSRYLDAARDLGATAGTAFRRVLLPLVAPGLVAGAILVFVPVMSAVLEPEILGGVGQHVTPTAIQRQFFHVNNWQVGAALTLTLLICGAAALCILAGTFVVGARAAGRFHIGRLVAWHPPILSFSEGMVGRASTALLLLFALGPLLVIAAFSFNEWRYFAFPFTGFTLQWYEELFADRRIWVSLANSVGIGLAVALTATPLGTAFAFAVVRGRFRGRRLASAVGFLPLVTPVLVLAAGLQVAFVTLNIPLGYATVLIGHTIYATPFVVLMVVAQLYRYDERLDRAARDLGAGTVSTLRHVTLPILLPSIRAGALLAFLLSFNEWAISFFTGRGFNTLPILVYSMQRTGMPPTVLAYSALIVGVVLVVALGLLPFTTRLVRGVAR